MNELPKISIVTPSLNQGAFLEETLQSLVDQNYPHLEVIIQDGKSTDDSVKIAEAFVQRHPELFKLYVESDRGQADALDRGFKRQPVKFSDSSTPTMSSSRVVFNASPRKSIPNAIGISYLGGANFSEMILPKKG